MFKRKTFKKELEKIDLGWLSQQLEVTRETINSYLDETKPKNMKRGQAIAWATVIGLDPLAFWGDEVSQRPGKQ